MPMLRLLGESRETSWLPKYTAPAVCVSRPAMIRISVVLPQPDGPRRQVTCPRGNVNDTSSTARKAPKVLVSCSTRISDNVGGPWPAALGYRLLGFGRLVVDSRYMQPRADSLGTGNVEKSEHVRVDRNRNLLVQIITQVVIAIDHGQGLTTGREVDDILTAEIFA